MEKEVTKEQIKRFKDIMGKITHSDEFVKFLDVVMKIAKKEIFDDIEKEVLVKGLQMYYQDKFNELKKRHLPPSAKEQH